MKKYLKVLLITILTVSLAGCMNFVTPSEKVEDFFNRYIRNDEEIIKELDTHLTKDNLTEDQRQKYKEIIKDEYRTINYNIKDEQIDGDEATVIVEISVKDLFSQNEKAEQMLIEDPTMFYSDGEYDRLKYIDYKLELMKQTEERVKYTITINLSKHEDTWYIEELDDEDLQKIHGIYNYKND